MDVEGAQPSQVGLSSLRDQALSFYCSSLYKAYQAVITIITAHFDSLYSAVVISQTLQLSVVCPLLLVTFSLKVQSKLNFSIGLIL